MITCTKLELRKIPLITCTKLELRKIPLITCTSVELRNYVAVIKPMIVPCRPG